MEQKKLYEPTLQKIIEKGNGVRWQKKRQYWMEQYRPLGYGFRMFRNGWRNTYKGHLDSSFMDWHSQIMSKKTSKSVIPVERIASAIYLIRGGKVMLDSALAALYGVETRALNQAVTRNKERFPPEFAF